MTYKPKLPPVDVPREKPNNKSILNAKFALDMITGATNIKSPDRAVRVGELLDSGLWELDSSGLLVPKDAATAASPANGGVGANMFLNSGMDYWQRRVAGVTGTGVQRASDIWFTNSIGYPSLPSRVPLAAILPEMNSPRYAHRISWTASSAGVDNRLVVFQQRFENAFKLLGRDLVMSIWINSDAPRTVTLEAMPNVGTVNQDASAKRIQRQLKAGWQRVTFPFRIPTLPGANLLVASYVEFTVWMAAGPTWLSRAGFTSGDNSAGACEFTAAKLEEGGATPWRQPDPWVDLMGCQRYFEKSYNLSDPPGSGENNGREAKSINTPGAWSWHSVRYKVQKYNQPFVTVYGVPSGILGTISQEDGSSPTTLAVESNGSGGFNIAWNNTAGHFGAWFHWTAEANV